MPVNLFELFFYHYHKHQKCFLKLLKNNTAQKRKKLKYGIQINEKKL